MKIEDKAKKTVREGLIECRAESCDVGLSIKSHRINSNMTQAELADRVGVSRTAISSWEVGRNEPSLDDLTTLSNIFRCPIQELIGPDRCAGCVVYLDEEKRLIDNYRKASPDTKAFIDKLLMYNNALSSFDNTFKGNNNNDH